MSNLKKFTDLMGGIGVFFASLYFVGQYMSFDPGELEEGMSKLDKFLNPETGREYRQYIILIGLMVFSIALGIVLKNHPAYTLVVSCLPLVQTMGMFFSGILYDHTEFYFIVSAMLVFGNVYELTYRDRAFGERQAILGTQIFGLFSGALAFVCLYLNFKAVKLSDIFLNGELSEAELELEEKLELLGVDIINVVPEGEKGALLFIAISLCVGVVISFVLKEAYFIDIIPATVTLVYTAVAMHAEKNSVAPAFVLVPVFVNFICRLVLFVSGSGIKDRQKTEMSGSEGSESVENT